MAILKNRPTVVSEVSLPQLITKCDWRGVYGILRRRPTCASIPIPTGSKWNVYPIHLAVCIKTQSVPCKVLLMMIKAYPEALDLNVFQGACENPLLSPDAMAILLDHMNIAVSELVKTNASLCTSIALNSKNVGTASLFFNRYPEIVNTDILIDACTYGTATTVEMILKAGVSHNKGRHGGLFLKNEKGDDAFKTALRLYDENDIERHDILSTCLQFANLDEKSKNVMPEPDYPVILAAIGRVPLNILESIVKLNMHEIKKTDYIGRNTILKAISMVMNDGQDEKLPVIFISDIFTGACTNGTPEMVQALLENDTGCMVDSHTCRRQNNALDIAISLYDSSSEGRCRILISCVQYANALRMRIKFPSPAYPSLLAAIGLVPKELLLSIGKSYRHEIKKTDRTGKAALKVVLRLAHENDNFSKKLFRKAQSPTQFDSNYKTSLKSRASLRISLETISEDS